MKLAMMKRHSFELRCLQRGIPVQDAAACIRNENGNTIVVDMDHEAFPSGPVTKTITGPGTELKQILGWFGIEQEAGCPCSDFALKMDVWGPGGCERELSSILRHLKAQAAKRRLPYSEFVAKRLVLLAIRRARLRAQKEQSRT